MAKENGWIKLLRVVIYAVSIPGVVIGASLIKAGGLSIAYADGTSAMKIENGTIIFFVALTVLAINIVWGVARWCLRGYNENWKIGRIIGKLIGGGIWRTLAITPLVLLSLFLITPRITAHIASQASDEDIAPVSLSQNYEDLKYISENLDTLSINEIEQKLAPLMFNNVDFGLDATSNVTTKNDSFFFKNASAYSSTVTILNKAKLSSKGHFVVFYTDSGDDKISDEKAEELAKMLEEIITGYKNNLDFDYEYEKLSNNSLKVSKIQSVLENSGIDRNILNEAMPVYVVNPYKNGSSTLATYAGRRFKDFGAAVLVKLGQIFGDETAALYTSTPTYPFINILPSNADSESLAIVTAHELGHHYAANYNYNHYGETGSDDDFIDETAPNWMAINVLPGQPSSTLINDNHYNGVYLKKSTNYTISEANPDFLGYPPVAFLENYYEIVPNAKTIIMDAVFYGDALNYLYEKAGEDLYSKVMVSLAEKNLTGNYDGKLINTTRPKGKTLSCSDLCSNTYDINPSATGYFYISTDEYKKTRIGFKGSDNVLNSILGLKYDGEFVILSSGETENDILISEEISKEYEIIAFAVANASLNEAGNYEIEIVAEELEDLLETNGNFDFSHIYSELEPGCYEIDTDSLFDNLLNFVNLGSDFIAAIDRLSSDDFSEAQESYNSATEEAKNSIIVAKNELSPYRIAVCANYLNSDSDFDSVKRRLQSVLEHNLNIYNEQDGAYRLSVFVGFDLLTRTGKVHALAQYGNEMGLVTISVSEK